MGTAKRLFFLLHEAKIVEGTWRIDGLIGAMPFRHSEPRSSCMSVVIAAAGSSSRFNADQQRGPKSLFPIEGKPLVAHIIDRIGKESELDNVLVVGAVGRPDGERVFDFLCEHLKNNSTRVRYVATTPQGYGYALWAGANELVRKGEGATPTLMTPCDTLVQSYGALLHHSAPVVLGVSRAPEGARKVYTSVCISEDGQVSFDASQSGQILTGHYRLDHLALEEFAATFERAISGIKRPPGAINARGEYSVSWIWKELQTTYPVAAAPVGAFAELNFPEDISAFREFICSSNQS